MLQLWWPTRRIYVWVIIVILVVSAISVVGCWFVHWWWACSPDYDSGWMNISDKNGEYLTLNHGLDSTNVVVYITGKTTAEGGIHQKHFGLTGYLAGFAQAYGGASYDTGESIVQTSDGGYAMAGYTSSYGAGENDFWLVKTDAQGHMQWSQTYGGTDYEFARSMVQTSDGGYAITGTIHSSGASWNDVWLVKTDVDGNEKWSRNYGGTGSDNGESLVQTSDGGYAIAGYTSSYGAGFSDAWLVKTDANGNVQWSQTYGGTNNDYANSVVETVDGGYALACDTTPVGTAYTDAWLIKTDAQGNVQWSKIFGGPANDHGESIVKTSDGGYAMAGRTASFGFGGYFDAWLIKTNGDGNEQWSRTYGGQTPDSGHSVVQTGDGGYAIAGDTSSYGAGLSDVWLIKTDADGNEQWNRTFGGTKGDFGYSLVQSRNGGYAIAGFLGSHGPDYAAAWLVKTDVESGLALTDSTANTVTLYRGATDAYWNYVRVRMWKTR